MTEKPIVISTFYRFVALPDYQELQPSLQTFCDAHAMKGSILLAQEGINSTISGTRAAIDAFFAYLDEDPRLRAMPTKESYADTQPFLRMKVRLKKEIVRMGMEELPLEQRGTYIPAKEWDAFIARDDVIVVDTRNDYEVKIGQFKDALNPNIKTFRAFPRWVEENLSSNKQQKIAMYCTGGIRCEKTTALLKQQGFDEVYHLEGGILQYFEETGNENNVWEGACFVFDDRVAVEDDLTPAQAVLCDQCGAPVTTDDLRQSAPDAQICSACADETKKYADAG